MTVIAGQGSEAREYQLHKIFLISQSDFLKVACLNPNFKEERTSTIKLPDIHADVFDIVVYWLYSRKLRYGQGNDENSATITADVISETNSHRTMGLIEAANFLGIGFLKDDIWDAVADDYSEAPESSEESWNQHEQRRLRALGKLFTYRSGSRINKEDVTRCYEKVWRHGWSVYFIEGLKTMDENEDIEFGLMREIVVLVAGWRS